MSAKDVSDLRDTIIPKSDQLNAEQLIGGSMTITVTDVKRGDGDQPVSIHYENDQGRPFKPCKTMRKILIFAWGDDGRLWVGKSMTLFCDPEVKFGGVKVGGIRISHLTHIERDLGVSLNTTKGKKGEFVIKKLAQIRSKAEITALLNEAATSGTQILVRVWTKTLSAHERESLGNACPADIKQAAADFDAAVPKNIEEQTPEKS
jgi:hypothetical protein